MYDSWSNEDLTKKYLQASTNYLELSSEVLPKLNRLSKLEIELKMILEEVDKRGIEIAPEKERG
jgi:hypothetical protein